jgi:hypothetical protein
MMGSPLSTTGVGGGGVGRMLDVGGGSSATLPSRSVQRDLMASILSGGAPGHQQWQWLVLLWRQ